MLIPVPFTDLSSTKRRPVLVLSSDDHNQRFQDVVVAAITSNLTTGAGGVSISAKDMEIGSLPTQSLVRADKIYTLSQQIVVKHYGRLNSTIFEQALAALDKVLGR